MSSKLLKFKQNKKKGNIFPYSVHSAKLTTNVIDSIKQRMDKLGLHGFRYAV